MTSALAQLLYENAKARFISQPLSSALGVSRTTTTIDLKRHFGDLGVHLNYQVAAAGYPGARWGEWLYDMVWCRQVGNNLVDQAAVFEFEHAPEYLVDGDFQKLTQARAEVRVWVAQLPTKELKVQHVKACVDQAKAFKLRQPGDTYLLITDHWYSDGTDVELFCVE